METTWYKPCLPSVIMGNPEHRPSPPPAPSACTRPLTTINTSTISGALTLPPPSPPSLQCSPLLHLPPSNLFTPTVDQVRTQLKKIKARKATGPDCISSRLLRDCADQLCQVVCYILNLSLSLERVPVLWKTSCVVPVPKTSSPKEPNHFRPVALTSHLMKALERIVLRHLRPLSSTAAAEIPVSPGGHWKHCEDYFFDFSSAFNTIHPSLLRVKLERAGASDQLAAWVTNYLTDRPQFVRLQDCVSDVVVCSTGDHTSQPPREGLRQGTGEENSADSRTLGFRRNNAVFCPGRGTLDQLYTLHRVLEGLWEFAQPVHMCFVDLEKAFDRVPCGIQCSASAYGVQGPLLRAVRPEQELGSHCRQTFQHVLGRFAAECEAAGMRMSTSKSEAMFLDQKSRRVEKSCLRFKYLGVLFTKVRERWSVRLTGDWCSLRSYAVGIPDRRGEEGAKSKKGEVLYLPVRLRSLLSPMMDELATLTRHQREYLECSLLLFTETWLTALTPDTAAELDGFKLLRADRNRESGKRKGGGMAVFVNDKMV
ncbi:hypothetical protein L3Q82_009685 [Scortum barcoo]|uniref:Uncharacterized protein n=1 Tax=Scortum barcoo TaxID=214431 RepID=A0ACB8WGR9_9TELE|nr:hypothetical protein L3Q82_009685 [Scortum barcoo]